MDGSRNEDGPRATQTAKELSIVGRGIMKADEPGETPLALRRERGVGRGSRGPEAGRLAVKISQEVTGFAMT
jgi:hypothetical protein